MKNITTLILFVVLYAIGSANAQKSQSTPIDELLNRKNQLGVRTGSVSEFFTQKEQLQLRRHFAQKSINYFSTNFRTNTVYKEFNFARGIAYCTENQSFSSQFSSIDLDSGEVTPIGNSTATLENAGAIGPFDSSTAYILDSEGNAWSVDVATGTYTALGSISGDWLGAEFDPTSGICYATAIDGNLYTIDFGTLTKTVVGPMGLSIAIALAIDKDGNAFTYDITDDNLYSINLSTAATTIIGSIGFDANFGQGMLWDEASDTVYMTAFNNTIFDAELRSVDTLTGATTLISQLGSGSLAQYGWVTAPAGLGIGVADNTIEGFSYYPNPANDTINLNAQGNIGTVTIFNILGQTVVDQNIDATSTQINVSNLSMGTYVMKVSVDGQVGTYKVIKR